MTESPERPSWNGEKPLINPRFPVEFTGRARFASPPATSKTDAGKLDKLVGL